MTAFRRTSRHSVDALPRWTPRWWLVLREWAALWRVLLCLRPLPDQPLAGSPVLLVPGFLAGDWSLRPAARHLRRRGFQTFMSGIRFNAGCTTSMVELLERRLVEVASVTGPVALVGHSRGGTLARLVAARRPDLVDRVVTLGSPLTHQFAASTHILTVAETLARRGSPYLLDDDCLRGDCADRIGQALASPLPPSVPLTSVLTRGDGIVVWRSCLPAGATAVRVRGTHNGLASSGGALAAMTGVLTDEVRHPRHPNRFTHPSPPPSRRTEQ